MRSFKNIINFLFKACPYSFIGRKCFDAVKGKTRSHTNKNLNDRILSFKLGIKTGRNIILIGVFCPILWYSILSGANKKFIELKFYILFRFYFILIKKNDYSKIITY